MTRAWGPPDASSSEACAAQPQSLQGLWAEPTLKVMPSCPWVRWRAQREEPSLAERGPGPGTAITAQDNHPAEPAHRLLELSNSLIMPSALTFQFISTVKVHLWTATCPINLSLKFQQLFLEGARRDQADLSQEGPFPGPGPGSAAAWAGSSGKLPEWSALGEVRLMKFKAQWGGTLDSTVSGSPQA